MKNCKKVLGSELGYKVGTANYKTSIELMKLSEEEIINHFNDILYKNISCKFIKDEYYMNEFDERVVLSPKRGQLFSQNGYPVRMFIGFINNEFSIYMENEGEVILDEKYLYPNKFWDDVFRYIKKYNIVEQCS